MINKVNDYELEKAYRAGTDVEEYAAAAGVSPHTVTSHLTCMAEAGVLTPRDVVGEDELSAVIPFLAKAEWDGGLKNMYRLLEGRYPYQALKLLQHSPAFLSAIEDAAGEETVTAERLAGRRRVYEERGRKWYRKIPGIYTYFIFDKEDENRVLFIDTTKNLGGVIHGCRDTASRVGYIEVETVEEGSVLAGYYTAGMNPAYPSHDGTSNVVTGIDETKRKPGMIRFGKE